MILLFIILISVFAGFYPAFVLSGLEPIKVLKGGNAQQFEIAKGGGKKIKFRQIMVILQLASSIALIIGSILIRNQLNFAQKKDLGHNPEQLIVLNNIMDDDMLQRFKNIKTDLEQYSGIVKVSGAYNVPGEDNNNGSIYEVVGMETEEALQASYIGVEKDFFNVLGAKIINGRGFLDNNIVEENNSCIINESAAQLFNISDDPIGRKISGFWDDNVRTIVGVVNDIHNRSLHENVSPTVYRIAEEGYPPYSYKILIKIRPENISETVSYIEKSWKKAAPTWPIEMRFISEDFENMYLSEKKLSTLISIFTFLAITISLTGLFGLIAFIAATRLKEISIRKTLGASVITIVLEMGREFIILTVIANVIAWPIIYWISINWLSKFSDSVSINFLWYPLSGLLVLSLVMLIVGYHSVRSANLNPVDALKYE